MLQITPQMRVLVAIDPIDGRKGIDSLARLCRDNLGQDLTPDPFSGCVFVFRTCNATTIKVLIYDGQWLLDGSEATLSGSIQPVAIRYGGRFP